jgi:hypothetical protein
MYTIDNDERHIGPGARGELIALLEMDPSERTQGWFPKQFDYGMYLLGEPLEKVRTFQSHVVRLAMEADMWAARCRLAHPGGAAGSSSRKSASDEYAATLERSDEEEAPAHHKEGLHGATRPDEESPHATMGSRVPRAQGRPPPRVGHPYAATGEAHTGRKA